MKTNFLRKRVRAAVMATILGASALAAGVVHAASPLPSGAGDCAGLPSHDDIRQALTKATRESNGGLHNEMWGTVENRDGFICAVAYTGDARGDQWPGS